MLATQSRVQVWEREVRRPAVEKHMRLLEDSQDNGRHEMLGDAWGCFQKKHVSSHATLKQAMDAALEPVLDIPCFVEATLRTSLKIGGGRWTCSGRYFDAPMLDVRIWHPIS